MILRHVCIEITDRGMSYRPGKLLLHDDLWLFRVDGETAWQELMNTACLNDDSKRHLIEVFMEEHFQHEYEDIRREVHTLNDKLKANGTSERVIIETDDLGCIVKIGLVALKHAI